MFMLEGCVRLGKYFAMKQFFRRPLRLFYNLKLSGLALLLKLAMQQILNSFLHAFDGVAKWERIFATKK